MILSRQEFEECVMRSDSEGSNAVLDCDAAQRARIEDAERLVIENSLDNIETQRQYMEIRRLDNANILRLTEENEALRKELDLRTRERNAEREDNVDARRIIIATAKERDMANESVKEQAARANKNHDAALGFQDRALRAEAVATDLRRQLDAAIEGRDYRFKLWQEATETAAGLLEKLAALKVPAHELAENFAWSGVTADCEELRLRLNSLIEELRAAIRWEKVGKGGKRWDKPQRGSTEVRDVRRPENDLVQNRVNGQAVP